MSAVEEHRSPEVSVALLRSEIDALAAERSRLAGELEVARGEVGRLRAACQTVVDFWGERPEVRVSGAVAVCADALDGRVAQAAGVGVPDRVRVGEQDWRLARSGDWLMAERFDHATCGWVRMWEWPDGADVARVVNALSGPYAAVVAEVES